MGQWDNNWVVGCGSINLSTYREGETEAVAEALGKSNSDWSIGTLG